MLGYVGMPRDEALDEDGFFHTGDGGYVDEAGRLFWEGRLTDIIKTGGANVSPREIDEASSQLSRGEAHADGGRAARDARRDRRHVHRAARGRVASKRGAIRAFARERLASYKVPRRVLFLREDELALTGSEKVKAGELRELAAERLQG